MGDRRPLATREYGFFKRIASWIAARNVSANAISVLGMFAGIAGGAALWATSLDSPYVRLAWIGGAVLVQLRLLANMFDGMVAIEQGKASSVGELYNEVPDRISDTAILIGLGYAVGGYVAMGYAAALAAMFTAYIRAMGKAGGAEPPVSPGARRDARNRRRRRRTACTACLSQRLSEGPRSVACAFCRPGTAA